MTDYVIPCDTFARLASVTTGEYDDGFKAIRIDNGVAVASDRKIIIVEPIASCEGVVHIFPDPALVKQCLEEAPFKSHVTVTVVEELGFATAKTMLGYIHPANLLLPNGSYEIDRWREVAAATVTPAEKPVGGMFWSMDAMTRLAAASPSGQVVFEEVIDTNRAVIVRDAYEPNWCAFFAPYAKDTDFPAATYPAWLS